VLKVLLEYKVFRVFKVVLDRRAHRVYKVYKGQVELH